MKIGEIKRQSLQLIFPELELSFDESDDTATNEAIRALRRDPSLRGYLDACVPAINRAFSIIECKGLSRIRKKEIIPHGRLVNGGIKIDLENEHNDIYKVVGVYQNGKELAYKNQDNSLIMYAQEKPCLVVYKSRVPRIFSYTPDSQEIDLDIQALQIIPYFVKSELQISENYEESARALKIFYEMLGLLEGKNDCDNFVVDVYSLG